jgi:hypothetical protein
MLIPGLQSEEAKQRFIDACRCRDDIDFKAFMLLRDMDANGMTNVHFFLGGFRRDEDMDENESKELATYYADEIESLIRDRRDADQAVSNAMLGRS